MAQLDQLKRHLRRGKVYRRNDLAKWSKSVDRHLEVLVNEGTLQKLSTGIYYYPKKTAFGVAPPEEETLVATFLKDKRFLVTSPNAYNSLGVGTTQLYNTRTVYNHKRHGEISFGNRKFIFKKNPHFPKSITDEFLLVDLVNNLENLAEDRNEVLKNVLLKANSLNHKRLQNAIAQYGNSKTKRFFSLNLNTKVS
jgi:hypothetical protein